MGKVLPFKQPDLIAPEVIRDIQRLKSLGIEGDNLSRFLVIQGEWGPTGKAHYRLVLNDLGRRVLYGRVSD